MSLQVNFRVSFVYTYWLYKLIIYALCITNYNFIYLLLIHFEYLLLLAKWGHFYCVTFDNLIMLVTVKLVTISILLRFAAVHSFEWSKVAVMIISIWLNNVFGLMSHTVLNLLESIWISSILVTSILVHGHNSFLLIDCFYKLVEKLMFNGLVLSKDACFLWDYSLMSG